MLLELRISQAEMGQLPLYIVLDHLAEIARGNRVVLVRPALGFVECFGRNRHAETPVERCEPVLPMQTFAIERAAHVKKNRANHWREITRLKAREKPAIGALLPEPENDKGQIHWDEDESEKQVDPMEADEDADGEKSSVVAEEIPAANQRIKDFAVTSAIFFPDAPLDRAGRDACFHIRMQSNQ